MQIIQLLCYNGSCEIRCYGEEACNNMKIYFEDSEDDHTSANCLSSQPLTWFDDMLLMSLVSQVILKEKETSIEKQQRWRVKPIW